MYERMHCQAITVLSDSGLQGLGLGWRGSFCHVHGLDM